MTKQRYVVSVNVVIKADDDTEAEARVQQLLRRGIVEFNIIDVFLEDEEGR